MGRQATRGFGFRKDDDAACCNNNMVKLAMSLTFQGLRAPSLPYGSFTGSSFASRNYKHKSDFLSSGFQTLNSHP